MSDRAEKARRALAEASWHTKLGYQFFCIGLHSYQNAMHDEIFKQLVTIDKIEYDSELPSLFIALTRKT